MKCSLIYASAMLTGMAVFSLATMPVRAQILDGGFEVPSIGGASYVTYNANSNNSFGNWTVTAGNIDLIGSYWASAEGTQSVDLSGTQAGAISQTVTTVAGQSYNLSFALAGNPDGVASDHIKTVNVGVDGNTSAFTFDVNGHSDASMGWTMKTLQFVAVGNSTVLSFASGNNSSQGPALDDVRLTPATPEPGSVALLVGMSLSGAGFLVRRRLNARQAV